MKKVIISAIIVALFAACNQNAPENNSLDGSTFIYLESNDEYDLVWSLEFGVPSESCVREYTNFTYHIEHSAIEPGTRTYEYTLNGCLLTLKRFPDGLTNYWTYQNDTIYYFHGAKFHRQ